jgi:hypothetical protein
MNKDRTRASAIANSLAYAAALARLYLDTFDIWLCSLGLKKPGRNKSL